MADKIKLRNTSSENLNIAGQDAPKGVTVEVDTSVLTPGIIALINNGTLTVVDGTLPRDAAAIALDTSEFDKNPTIANMLTRLDALEDRALDSTASVTFDENSSGSFSLSVLAERTPISALFDQDYIRKDTATAGILISAGQVGMQGTISVLGDKADLETAGVVKVQISSFAVGKINGTIISNTLGSGEQATLAVIAFA